MLMLAVAARATQANCGGILGQLSRFGRPRVLALGAWSTTDADARDNIAEQMSEGLHVLEALYSSRTVIQPKGESHEEPGAIRTSASTIRPCADRGKLVTLQLNRELGASVAEPVDAAQTGLILARWIDHHIIGVGRAMAAFILRAAPGATGFFLDFAAALPSLEHGLLGRLLIAIGTLPQMRAMIDVCLHQH